jgi:REP element-mobilizing transposase RayT
MKTSKQGRLPFPPGRGGRRRGAGRKPKGERAGVPHTTRPRLASRFPVHVTLRIRDGLPSLRRHATHALLHDCFVAASRSSSFRLTEYSVQTNHVHAIVEAAGRAALSRGMKGLGVRVARALNRLWQRRGSVLADRYHAHVLRTPTEVRNALRYVLHNARKHGRRVLGIDPFSSGRWFTGWRDRAIAGTSSPLVRARTWLQSKGWRRRGLLSIRGVPG